MNDVMIKMSNKPLFWRYLLITLISCFILTLLVFLIWNIIPKDYDRAKIANPDALVGVSNDETNDFKSQLLRLLEEQELIANSEVVEDIVIREDSVVHQKKYVESKLQRRVSFLVDIDSLKQTYRVNIYTKDGEITDLPVQITCPLVSEMKYSDEQCAGVYGSTSKSLRNNLPHELKTVSGETVLVKQIDATRDGLQLVQVYLYSCDTKNPLVKEAEELVRKWVEEIGDESRDSYTYNIRSGYCEGDTI
ncbi:MAG: hypothetical protein Q4A70_01195 [Candidatus Saccharibacteria bacterium]|nr:hypothetical protein [Candidatus Saccharibacteria bacterium]